MHVKNPQHNMWIVSELFYPDSQTTSYFLTEIAHGLSSCVNVHVRCGWPQMLSEQERVVSKEVIDGIDVERCKGTRFNKDLLILRFINSLTISISIGWHLFVHLKANDVVLAVTNPPILPYLGVIACKLKGARFILLIHDLYPDVLVAADILDSRSIVTILLRRLNAMLFRASERIVVLGRDVRDRLMRDQSELVSKICIVQNWARLDVILPTRRDRNRLLVDLNIEKKFVVQCAGNMGRTHDLECAFEAAKKVSSLEDIHFLFIGRGVKQSWLKTEIEKCGLRNASCFDFLPASELSDVLNACDVSLIVFVPGMAGISVPSRMYNIMAAGKPIIAVTDGNSELAMVIREEQIGWVVPAGDCDKLVESVLQARANPQEVERMGQRSRSVCQKKYSKTSALLRYRALVETMWN